MTAQQPPRLRQGIPLAINGLQKAFGERQVLRDINLHIPAGQFVAIVGRSGCGKSTLMRLLAGLDQPTRGEVWLDGVLVDGPGADRGMVFQSYTLFPWLTVEQNICFGLQERGVNKAAQKERSDYFINKVGLRGFEHHFPRQLSGGMQQRLAIAQALMKKPRILLLDEPFGALDPGIRGDMHQLIRELWLQQQLTIFMVTHDLKEGFALGSRLWVFDKTRHDPQSPQRYGAQITYDIPLQGGKLNAEDAALLPQPEKTEQ